MKVRPEGKGTPLGRRPHTKRAIASWLKAAQPKALTPNTNLSLASTTYLVPP